MGIEDDPRYKPNDEPLPFDPEEPLLWDRHPPPRSSRWIKAIILLLVGALIFAVAVIAGPGLEVID